MSDHEKHLSAGLAHLPTRGRLFVVSGPSGVGKDTVLDQLHRIYPHIKQCTTVSTRQMRDGESQGHPYFFVPLSEFRQMEQQDAFLEYAHVNGNFYGTPRAGVEAERDNGHDVLLKIDVQGGLNVRKIMRDAVLVFLAPPSVQELERRLRDRGTETEDQITTRLLDARSELQDIPNYDYLVINNTVADAADQIRSIFMAERCRVRHA